jgi:hypothetical protein
MRFPRLFRRREREEWLAEEIRFHVDMQTEKNVRLGMSPELLVDRDAEYFGQS